MLHQLAVWAVVDNIFSENRCSQGTIYLFSVDILGLAIQDKLVALGADVDGCLFAKEDESEDIAKLRDSVLMSVGCQRRGKAAEVVDGLTFWRFSTKNRGGSMP